MGTLDGKVAIVTGAGRGIGREHSLALARAGARVVVNDLGGSAAGEGQDAAPAQQVADEIKGAGGEATPNFDNVADFQGAENLVKQAVGDFGRLDILVNNAGIIRDRMLVNLTEDEWDSVIAVHLKGHFAPTRHAAAYWRGQSKAGNQINGRVVNTSSPSGVFGNVGQTNYGAAKAGIAAFTIIAALELGRYGVTVNCLAPNARTRLTEQTFGDIPAPEGGFDAMDPANISPVVVALASDAAQAITGQCFFVYGGVVNVLAPWNVGVALTTTERWDPDDLLQGLSEAFPDGIAPEGMMPMMVKATGAKGCRLVEKELHFELPVERGKVREFALAVGEDNPVFFDVEEARRQGFPDIVAPPTFAVTQIWQIPREQREEKLGAGLDYERVLHGEQEFSYRRLPFGGEVLNAVMRISKDVTKEGRRGGSMRFVTYESVFTDAQGEDVLSAYYTLIETAKDPGS